MTQNLTKYQFILGLIFGAVIACAPTKFTPTAVANGGDGVVPCTTTATTTCTVDGFFQNLTEHKEIGTGGRVDILFVSDNSASMSSIQEKLKERFSGFIQNLDSKKIDYRIAVTTTDLTSVNSERLIIMNHAKTGDESFYISNSDADRKSLFYSAILRIETLTCENFIIGMFNSFGNNFQSQSEYASQYSSKCPSPDTRGIYAPYLAISENAHSFLRSDASLNVIVISNDEARQGKIPLEKNDQAENFIAMMQQTYPTKYWDFNSIIVKDATCQGQQVLKNAQGEVVMNQTGPAVQGGIGYEYAKLSNSAAKDIDKNPRPRGSILNICENDYAQHFTNMATQISEESRMVSLRCSPSAAPIVSYQNGSAVPNSLYTWSSDKITFKKGSEGSFVKIEYKCYFGPQ